MLKNRDGNAKHQLHCLNGAVGHMRNALSNLQSGSLITLAEEVASVLSLFHASLADRYASGDWKDEPDVDEDVDAKE